MIVNLSRFVFTVAGALAAIAVSKLLDWASQLGVADSTVIILFVILGGAVGYLLGGIIGRELERLYDRIEERLKEYAAGDIALAAVGLLMGLVIALLLSTLLRPIGNTAVVFLVQVFLYGLLAFTGVRVALLKSHDMRTAVSRFAPEDASDAPRGGSLAKYLDTSAVIDGRFVDLRRMGLLEGPLRVPRFVLVELQTLADSADDIKRARGRRGLDLLQTLGSGSSAIEVFEVDYLDTAEVDTKLTRLAKDAEGMVVTVDANLTKVARVQGIPVLNVNEIAAALKPNFQAGESMNGLAIVREGKESDQGVGYLEDGTMVVVQGAREFVGSHADVVVTSVLQTAVGRMVFARVKA